MGQVKPFNKKPAKWDFHPHYEFSLKLPTGNIIFYFNSGNIAKDSGDPNGCFQLIMGKRGNRHETTIYTDESRSGTKDGEIHVGSAVVILDVPLQMGSRLNDLSSS